MSRIISVTLLLIILVDNFCNSTASHARLQRSREKPSTCECRVLPKREIKCRSLLFPKKPMKKLDQVKCFCSKTIQHKFPKIQATCRLLYSSIPITLV